MTRKKGGAAKGGAPGERGQPGKRSPTLKQLAQHLGLAPATVSTVMNGGVSSGIAADTQQRIREAARELGYRPNFLARCLRTRKSYTIGVIIPEVSQGYNVLVLKGIEDFLVGTDYFYFVASHHNKPALVEDYAYKFLDRAADALVVVSADWRLQLDVPVATVSSHQTAKGATRIELDHDHAAELGLRHLMDLGHRRIAFIQGPAHIPDSAVRWRAITAAAGRLGLPLSDRLVAPILDDTPSCPKLGYDVTRRLLAGGAPFTALWAFNDVTAVGAINALQESGRRVPHDVSVLGFDDIEATSFQGPGLSTIRQPLEEMGKLAAQAVLAALAGARAPATEIVVRPELVVRETTTATADAPPSRRRPAKEARRVEPPG